MPSTASSTASAQRGACQSLSASGFMRKISVLACSAREKKTPAAVKAKRAFGLEGSAGGSERINKAAQLVGTRRMLELAQCLCLDLANALARHVELLAHLFQRVVGRHLDAEAHAQHLGLARRQAVEDVLDHVAQAGLHGG